MTPLRCYFHVAPLGRWEPIFREMIARLRAAGLREALAKLVISWAGSGPRPWLMGYGTVVPSGGDTLAGEVPTLRRLHADCQADPRGYVLYIHVKGACHPPGAVDRWRDHLASGVIDRWRECVAALDDGHDAAGNEWYGPEREALWREVWGLHGLDFAPHFAGNFWWARADYIARLPRIPMCTRFSAEYNFIGLGNPRVYCPEFRGIDWYTTG